ncbi:hypothetical protein FACUT_5509 [Fusarium acutatum]|uniref:DUF7908 domain-containing protein n=1 Tax=Fusarium acutatum TaxID=78861 RepID=A0A8H4JTY0_9HYPO|nr:hypothetical protein FACUT_5509 [Fusarium acutatum]
MKSQTILTTVLGASGVLSQADHGAMSLDTWCVTYLSTYLVPVVSPGQPTGASSSVPVTQIEPQSTVEIEPTQAQSGSETVSFDSTTGTLTDQITISSGSIVSSDVLTTSTGIIEPPDRSVIFLISAPNTRKRQNTDKGFVGNNNPSICTFAQSFNLAEEQLFINGVPFFYDGEDYKELVVGPAPPAGAVTRLFGTTGRALQVDLPGVTAGFCQASDGSVYVTFTSRPVGCEVVILEVYDERQCQNGRLVGLDTTTSAIETATSEAISSESVTSVESSATTETTASSSNSIDAPSSIDQTQSVGPISQTTVPEASTAASSSAVESTPISSTTSIAVSEVSTLSPASSSVLDQTTTDEVFPTNAPSLVSTTTEAEESTSIEPTSQASSETTGAAESSSEESTSAATPETTTEAGQSATETTTAVEEITTENETATESKTTAADSATEDTTTAVFTTEESSTVATSAEETTTEDLTTIESTIDPTITTSAAPPPPPP